MSVQALGAIDIDAAARFLRRGTVALVLALTAGTVTIYRFRRLTS